MNDWKMDGYMDRLMVGWIYEWVDGLMNRLRYRLVLQIQIDRMMDNAKYVSYEGIYKSARMKVYVPVNACARIYQCRLHLPCLHT